MFVEDDKFYCSSKGFIVLKMTPNQARQEEEKKKREN